MQLVYVHGKNFSNLVQKDTELDPPQSTGTKNLHFFPTRQCFRTKSDKTKEQKKENKIKKHKKNKKTSEISSPLQNTRRSMTSLQLQHYLENSSAPEEVISTMSIMQ